MKKAKHTVTDAEIQLLQTLQRTHADWTAKALVRLSTDDGEQARTYADMMEKRRALHPDAQTPPTLGELFGLATAYLRRSGRIPTLAHHTFRLTHAGCPERAIAANGSPLCLDMTNATERTVRQQAGDRLLLLHTPENESDRLRFLETPELRKALKWEAPVSPSGILFTVLPLTEGICYDLHTLPAVCEENGAAPLARLLAPIPNASLILIAEPALPTVLGLAARNGISAVPVAVLTEGGDTAFVYGDNDIRKVQTAWLRTLPQRERLDLQIPTNNIPSPPPVRGAAPCSTSAYLAPSEQVPDRFEQNGITVASAVRSLTGNHFRAAMATVLAPLLSLAAGGADTADIRLAIGLRLPEPDTPQKQGELTAILLGAYRAQIEFACPASLFAEVDSTLSAPELTVFALTDTVAPLPAAFHSCGTPVCCVTPIFTDAGIPDFQGLRQLLAELRALRAAGKLISAHLAVAETLERAILRASGAVTCRLDEQTAADTALSLGFLLEGAGLPFTRIGTTQIGTHPAKAEQPFTLPPLCGKYLWSDRYEITVLSHPNDADAKALAALLRQAGADCLALSDRLDEGPLSRRILTSRLLLLCPNAQLPQGAHMQFALRMLTANGGLILRLGEEAPSPNGFASTLLLGGFPSEILQRIADATPDSAPFFAKKD